MNRSGMRTLLRRRLLEPTADQWDDSTLNDLLNLALSFVRKHMRKSDPEFDIRWEYRDTVAGTSFYEKPAGTRGLIELGLKLDASASDYTPLVRRPYHVARTNTSAAETFYCHRGAYIGIFPAPSASIVQGISFMHAPTETLAADTDISRLDDTLQYAAVVWAALLAKGESPEDDSKDAKELARILGDSAVDVSDLGQPTYLQPDIADARGMVGGRRFANDIDRWRSAL